MRHCIYHLLIVGRSPLSERKHLEKGRIKYGGSLLGQPPFCSILMVIQPGIQPRLIYGILFSSRSFLPGKNIAPQSPSSFTSQSPSAHEMTSIRLPFREGWGCGTAAPCAARNAIQSKIDHCASTSTSLFGGIRRRIKSMLAR